MNYFIIKKLSMESFGFTNSIRYVKEILSYYTGGKKSEEINAINPNYCNICLKDIKKCNYVSRFWFTTVGHVHIEDCEDGEDNFYQCNGTTCNSCKMSICYTCAKQCKDCNRFLCVKCVKYIYIETEKEIDEKISNISYELEYWDKEYDTSFIPKCSHNCLYGNINDD